MKELHQPIAIGMAKDIEEALRQFGAHAYYDKGPSEVMDVDKWVTALRNAGVNDALLALKELVEYGNGGIALAVELLCEMQDWDELFEADTDFTDEYYH